MVKTKSGKMRQLLRVAIFLLGVALTCAAQSAPQVVKVEPPNWWANHSINPVRVLIHGRNLSGAQVTTASSSLQVGRVQANAAGTYLFVDVTIDAKAQPGRYPLRITTSVGTVEAPFAITAPLDRAERFQGFTSDDVIYLIMTDRFSDGDQTNDNPSMSAGLYDRAKSRYYHGGDFQGIINHLSYLKELGVTAIWLTPWYDNVNHLNERERYPEGDIGEKLPITDYHGYGATDFYGVEEHFGTLAKLQELVEAAHRAGIKVIQDQVANHTGPYHSWVNDSPTPTWYNGTESRHRANTFQTWVLHDPHAVEEMKREVMDGWFINLLPDLNQNDEETRRYLIQNTLWWIGITGIDAIRQDTWQYVPNRFWHDWMAAIKGEYPKVNVVGEVFDGDPAHVSFYQGGQTRNGEVDSGLDTLFDFPLLYPIRRAFASGKPLKEVAQILAYDQLYPRPDVLVTLIGNHDMQRFMNEPGATVAGLNLAHTLLMTMRGTPQLYYGDEIAIAGAGDPDNRRDFPGGFPGDSRDAFKVATRTAEQQSVFARLKRLAQLRAQLEPLRRGKLINLFVADQQYAFARATAQEVVCVVFNNDEKAAMVEFPAAAIQAQSGTVWIDQLATVPEIKVEGDTVRIQMPPKSAAIFTRK